MNNLTTEQIKWLVDKAGKESGFRFEMWVDCPAMVHLPDGISETVDTIESSPWFPFLVHRAIDGINSSDLYHIDVERGVLYIRDFYTRKECFKSVDHIIDHDQARLSALLWVMEHEG